MSVRLVRRLVSAFTLAYGAAFIAAIVTSRLLGLDGAPVALVTGIATCVGAVGGWREGADLPEWTSRERRDAVIGWGIFAAIVGAIAAALVPLPWAILAGLGWVAAVGAVCRALLGWPRG